MTYVPHKRPRYRTSKLRGILELEISSCAGGLELEGRSSDASAASEARQAAAAAALDLPCSHSRSASCRKCIGRK